ncbi:hypothetical protein D6C86_00060 [Aureobasidium pullulans]|uniref:Uncharacterized protein n=1 Tax=Aureobasidium pullulans TaxID=5580 RepID=A0A4S9UGF1_AURPU|nr:hypothetical protein D6C94_00597 [Aureobasidium pullulans]THZ36657.1 hypothetical protein D6C87_09023 [Aureobasidium pullulans]THZ68286.1 hypothetical protein D6C86_00060 [Aureobasidium pullulans]THZ98278.1 hypothetical protein D6C88_00945 [Aureobasidium pullulans]
MDTFMGTPSKRRSVSDATATAARLQPSPLLTSRTANATKDDSLLSTSPQTPRRPDFLGRGLSLQMPTKTTATTATTSMAAPNTIQRVPLSPQLDTQTSYASPQTSLPRHSRGLDFSRACTNLHHSTLAEHPSPDSSPIITQSARKPSMNSMMLDSPNLWPQMQADRSAVSSSVGSVSMLADEDSDESTSDDDVMDDMDDQILTTPQVRKTANPQATTPFGNHNTVMWSNNFSPAHASLMKTFQRSRLKKGRSRKSSSSASNNSAMPSPRTASPPPLRSIEGSTHFGWPRLRENRQEQPSLSSGNDSGDEAAASSSTPGVVRRAVTRRGNLLPKTKNFARIRAALLEESAPVDSEVRREAETMRQVHNHDPVPDLDGPSPGPSSSQPNANPNDPNDPQPDTINNNPISFNLHAHRNSGGVDYWHKLETELHTPPPPAFPTRGSSSLSGDIAMDSPADNSTLRSASVISMNEPSIASSAETDTQGSTYVSQDALRRPFGKRRRDDDFDMQSFKRRAVSPSMSVHGGSPVVASPVASAAARNQSLPRDGAPLEKSTSNGASGTAPRRIGLQGMVDTNEGIMRMSIE